MNRNAGFTLIELIVTLVLAAIILTVGVPSFREAIQNNRRTTQVNEFVSALNITRSEAIKRGMQITLCKSSDATNCNTTACNATTGDSCWEKGWIIFADANANGTLDVGEIVINIHSALRSDSTLRTGTNFSNWIAYLSNGLSKGNGGAANGMFNLCDPRGADQASFIVINPTGRARVTPKQTGYTCP